MRGLFCTGLLLINFLSALSQVFEVETIHNSGNLEDRINLVILSDGYQESEFPKFIIDANQFTNKFLNTSPFKEYANYFNIYIIKVPSNESGASHPGTATDSEDPEHPISVVDNYFGSTFDVGGIHRLLGPANSAAINNVLANNFPLYDQILILVNSPYYGGSGGTLATASTDSFSAEVAIHELGHSFGHLADEYYAGDVFAAEARNMTQETDPSLVRWKNWYNDNGVGIYQHCCDGNSSIWYRPHENCKMRVLGAPFCSVCSEGIIEKIHNLVTPIDSYLPSNNTINEPNYPIEFNPLLVDPFPNTLKKSWQLNQSSIAENLDSLTLVGNDLSIGLNELTLVVLDTTQLQRIDNHQGNHQFSITWVIDNSDSKSDDDNDKVPDNIDQCPDTPNGESVDSNGCSQSQLDDDIDGVTNDLDQCPDTLAGQSADANGCSQTQNFVDADSDGVADDNDQCPDTPNGESVDSNGCSQSQLDDDIDGVTNDLDQCPDTLAGQSVDENGCMVFLYDAFTLYTESTACPGVANGHLEISTSAETNAYVFDVQIEGNGFVLNYEDILSYNNTLSISGLAPGTYTVTISLENGFNIVFDYVVIAETGDLTADKQEVNTNSKTALYKVSGNLIYSVSVNQKVYSFKVDSKLESAISVPLEKGENSITIKGADCQSVFKDQIILPGIVLYPNPVSNGFYISGSYKGKAALFGNLGNLIKEVEVETGNYIDIQELPAGVYFLHFKNENREILKIIKQ